MAAPFYMDVAALPSYLKKIESNKTDWDETIKRGKKILEENHFSFEDANYRRTILLVNDVCSDLIKLEEVMAHMSDVANKQYTAYCRYLAK
jgi:cytidylate kinase